MEEKATRFSYVYQNLKERILTGQLQPGSRLSSSRKLCQEYQVGIRTINEVLDALKKEGLIKVEPRKAPVICQKGTVLEPEAAVLAVLAAEDDVRQVYQTMTLLLPQLLTFSSWNCPVEELPYYKKAMKVDRMGLEVGGWRAVSGLFQDVLHHSGNPLFADVYSAIELHGRANFFIEDQYPFTGLTLRTTSPMVTELIAMLKGPDPVQKYRKLTAMYENLASQVDSSLHLLRSSFPDCPTGGGSCFEWNPVRGRDHYYTRIVRDLVNKIGSGAYKPGSYLPREADLAKEYGVSVFTVRNALAQLGRLGFGKTYNVKGTMVTIPNDSTVLCTLQNQVSKQDTLLYIYALHFLSLAIGPSARLAAPLFTAEEIKELVHRFKDSAAIPLGDIYDLLLNHLQLEPLRTIFSELRRLVQWGYYFAFYRIKSGNIDKLNQKALEALQSLQNSDVSGFADGLSECYCLILDTVRQFVVEKYDLREALNLRIPKIVRS